MYIECDKNHSWLLRSLCGTSGRKGDLKAVEVLDHIRTKFSEINTAATPGREMLSAGQDEGSDDETAVAGGDVTAVAGGDEDEHDDIDPDDPMNELAALIEEPAGEGDETLKRQNSKSLRRKKLPQQFRDSEKQC